jgi:hypothetical protein
MFERPAPLKAVRIRLPRHSRLDQAGEPADQGAPGSRHLLFRRRVLPLLRFLGLRQEHVGVVLATSKTLDPSSLNFHWVDHGFVLRSRAEDNFISWADSWPHVALGGQAPNPIEKARWVFAPSVSNLRKVFITFDLSLDPLLKYSFQIPYL